PLPQIARMRLSHDLRGTESAEQIVGDLESDAERPGVLAEDSEQGLWGGRQGRAEVEGKLDRVLSRLGALDLEDFARRELAPSRASQVRHLADDHLLDGARGHRRRRSQQLVGPGLAQASAEEREARRQMVSA